MCGMFAEFFSVKIAMGTERKWAWGVGWEQFHRDEVVSSSLCQSLLNLFLPKLLACLLLVFLCRPTEGQPDHV